MNKSLKFLCVAVALVFLFSAQSVLAGQINPADLLVERIGGTAQFTAGAALTSAATAVFVDEFPKSTVSAPAQTIALPTVVSGANKMLTDSGSATSNGYLNRSADGTVVTIPGYNATVGTTSVAGSNPATINRTIGVLTPDGNVDTSRTFNNGPSNNFRSVIANGANIYTSTAGTAGSVPGIGSYDSGTGTITSVLNGNTRNIGVFGGQTFASSSSSTTVLGIISSLGAIPLTAGTGNASPYGFVFFDLSANDYSGTGLDTLYVADDRSKANGGGLQKWTYDGAVWSLAVTYTTGLTSGQEGLRGLTGEIVSGSPVLYATNVGSTQNSLFTLTDTGVGSSFAKICDSPNNSFFRGVALAPVPEPSTIVLLIAGCFGFAAFVYRRSK